MNNTPSSAHDRERETLTLSQLDASNLHCLASYFRHVSFAKLAEILMPQGSYEKFYFTAFEDWPGPHSRMA